jgi:hypothetical protein
MIALGKFERDLVIANDDGKVYRIQQEDLNKLQHVDLASSQFQLIRGLLAQGVSTAAIPTDSKAANAKGPEPDAFCYLVNLASLKHKTVFEGKKPSSAKAPAKGGKKAASKPKKKA